MLSRHSRDDILTPCAEPRDTAGAPTPGRRGIVFRMPEYRFTVYFEEEVLRKRPYLRREWCVRVVEQPVRVERQEDNRWRFWAPVADLGGRVLRVVTLDDRTTIHNAFPDRGFMP